MCAPALPETQVTHSHGQNAVGEAHLVLTMEPSGLQVTGHDDATSVDFQDRTAFPMTWAVLYVGGCSRVAAAGCTVRCSCDRS